MSLQALSNSNSNSNLLKEIGIGMEIGMRARDWKLETGIGNWNPISTANEGIYSTIPIWGEGQIGNWNPEIGIAAPNGSSAALPAPDAAGNSRRPPLIRQN